MVIPGHASENVEALQWPLTVNVKIMTHVICGDKINRRLHYDIIEA